MTDEIIGAIPPSALRLLLRPPEAAKALAVSERTLWSLAQRGEIPRVRIGRAVCYSVDALRAYISRREQEGGGHDTP